MSLFDDNLDDLNFTDPERGSGYNFDGARHNDRQGPGRKRAHQARRFVTYHWGDGWYQMMFDAFELQNFCSNYWPVDDLWQIKPSVS